MDIMAWVRATAVIARVDPFKQVLLVVFKKVYLEKGIMSCRWTPQSEW